VHPVVARRRVDLPKDEVYAALADMRDHFRLADQWVEPVELGADGGVVRLCGPLGLRRTARTHLRERTPGERLAGEAVVGRTRADVAWTFAADGDATIVTLRADVTRVATADRLALALGGRRWLQNRFARTLDRLG